MRLYLTEEECYLEKGVIDVAYIRIEDFGTAIIEDTTPLQYLLYLYKTTLNIYKDTKENPPAVEFLFKYKGRLKIKRALLFSIGGSMEHLSVKHKSHQYVSENLNTNSEDMGLLSEEMYNKKRLNVRKTKLKHNIISNINNGGRFFKKDGTKYEGTVHRLLEGPLALSYYSGGTHDKDSKLLYIKKGEY